MKAATVLAAGLLSLCLPLAVAQAPTASGAQTPAIAATAGDGAKAAAPVATVSYQFARPGLPVPRFHIVLREDGTGRYEGEEVSAAARAQGGDAPIAPPAPVAREMVITPATTAKVFKTARAEKFFNTACASKAKNIADTGAKTLSYEGPDGRGSCSYNFTENKGVVMLTDLFLGISQTLEEGRKLEFKRRYDRLGLDAELDVLTQASDAGRAVELGTIAPLLRELASDTELMQRVRLRAAKLLDRVADGR